MNTMAADDQDMTCFAWAGILQFLQQNGKYIYGIVYVYILDHLSNPLFIW